MAFSLGVVCHGKALTAIVSMRQDGHTVSAVRRPKDKDASAWLPLLSLYSPIP